MVTPHTGVWIETKEARKNREFQSVTPHTGVWIETLVCLHLKMKPYRHAPHGRVD